MENNPYDSLTQEELSKLSGEMGEINKQGWSILMQVNETQTTNELFENMNILYGFYNQCKEDGVPVVVIRAGIHKISNILKNRGVSLAKQQEVIASGVYSL